MPSNPNNPNRRISPAFYANEVVKIGEKVSAAYIKSKLPSQYRALVKTHLTENNDTLLCIEGQRASFIREQIGHLFANGMEDFSMREKEPVQLICEINGRLTIKQVREAMPDGYRYKQDANIYYDKNANKTVIQIPGLTAKEIESHLIEADLIE